MRQRWLEQAVFYQIYPQSFADSNGDGIGDLPGIIGKLDYLEALGVNALWLNPVFDSPFLDAGYDVRDFFNVAPRYGSNDDVRALCEAAHERGMRVCLDLVPGHTSADHPGFVESALPHDNDWSDRFVWTDNPWVTRDGELTYISGMHDRMGAYAVNFFAHQPALNYGFAEPRRSAQQRPDAPGPQANVAMLREVMGHWLEHGVDGFRVDLAASLVKNDPHKAGVSALWRDLRGWLERTWPEAVLISEWGDPAQAVAAGFDVDFMLHFGTPGYPELMFNGAGFARIRSGVEHCYFDRGGRGDVRHFLGAWQRQHEMLDVRGAVGLPSANHDFQRPRSGEREPEDLAVIFAMLLTWPALPFIYYGDEIGMRYLDGLPSKEGGYQRTGTRTPMQWDASEGAGFSAAPPEAFYLPLDAADDRPDVASQLNDEESLWRHVHALVAARRALPALSVHAELVLLSDDAGYPLVYVRRQEHEAVLVALQPAAGSVRFELPEGMQVGAAVSVRGARIEAAGDGHAVLLDGPACGVWQLDAHV